MEESPQVPRRRNLSRFSLFALFLLISCIAGYFSGYRWGVDEKRENLRLSTITVQTYNVADLVVPIVAEGEKPGPPDFDSLIDLIVTTIDHDTWLVNGTGMGEIHPFPANLSLVVSQTGSIHDQLRDLLQQLRDAKYKLPEKYLESFREAVARRRNNPKIITWNPRTGTKEHQRIEHHFESAIRELTDIYGDPELTAKAGEAEFPKWALGQRIAIWDMPGGKLYFALQDARPSGETLVAGWWEDSFGQMQPVEFRTNEVAKAE